jgi:outer membrane protein OmpA-like peptidoglycan-associated protein
MNIHALTLTALAAALAACSSVPEQNAALDRARSDYNAAQADPQVVRLASDELKRAAEALRVAEQAQATSESVATVDHRAYLADQRVTLAVDAAASRAAQESLARAGAERDQLRLAARTQEADTAKQALAASEQTNARTAATLDQTRAVGAAALAERDAQLVDMQAQMQAQLQALNARQTDRGMVVTLGDLLFATGKAQLQGSGEENIAKLAAFMNHNPGRSASIEGYTDSTGSASFNRDLSDRRAQAVMAALVRLGVPASRLSAQGHGEDGPVADNATSTGRQMNRRVEVVFANPAADAPSK